MKKWVVEDKKENYRKIIQENQISNFLAIILGNRGIVEKEEIEIFLNPSMEKTHSPFLMKDLEKGCNLLIESLKNDEKIRIMGDYDQDGNSSTVILYKALKRFSKDISYDIPNRLTDGYGLNIRMVERAIEDEIELIITCDNGISALEAVKLAEDNGIKVIVTDHHQVISQEESGEMKQTLPDAHAIIDPQRLDCEYPFNKLCGAGVAYKFMEGLYEKLGLDKNLLQPLLAFVAMGTVCDIVDLVDENRVFVKKGLEILNSNPPVGFTELLKAANYTKEVTEYTLGFITGPCVNAVGRFDDAKIGVNLFLTEDVEVAEKIANHLVKLNEKRKALTEKGVLQIEKQIVEKEYDKNLLIVVKDKDIHESIAGIIAGKIKEKYNRPSFVLTGSKDDDILKGSGRSIEAYDMFENISKAKEFFIKFGGHPMAAGFSLEEKNLDSLRDFLIKNSPLTFDDISEILNIDLIYPINYVNEAFIKKLEELKPFGKGNHKPLFRDNGINLQRLSIIGKNKNVLKFNFLSEKKEVEGIMFENHKEILDYLKQKFKDDFSFLLSGINRAENLDVDIVYQPQLNEYMGNKTVQLLIKDIK